MPKKGYVKLVRIYELTKLPVIILSLSMLSDMVSFLKVF